MINFLIFLGAGLGGVFRFWVANGVHFICGRQFPYGTLCANISGCFLMGLIFILLLNKHGEQAEQLRAFMLIGFMGGYTTFSAFSLDTLHLLESGAWLSGCLNIFLSVILCLMATSVGMYLARHV